MNIRLYSNENWIPINPTKVEQQVSKVNPKLNVDFSKLKPVNKIMKRVIVIKQLIDASTQEVKVTNDDKKWFIINKESKK